MPYLESAPPLGEIAERLSLIQRWNGRTTIPWTVLHHTLLAVSLLPETASQYLRLTVLLHDAAEGWTGDIPRPFKCPEQTELEREILAEIYAGLNLVAPWPHSIKAQLRHVDDVTAVVEAQCLCRPSERRSVVAKHLEIYSPEPALVERGEDILWAMKELTRAEVVTLWVKLVESTLEYFVPTEEDRI